MIVAMAAAWLAVWWWLPPVGGAVGRLNSRADGVRAGRRSPLPVWMFAAPAAIVGATILFGTRAGVLVAAAGLVGVTGRLLRRRALARRRRRSAAEQVARGCAVLADEVRAGRAATQALVVAAEEHSPFAPVAAAGRVGGSIAEGLRRAARVPGQEGLGHLARAWQVSERTGAALGPALVAVAVALRAEQAVTRTVGTELAAPRATGQLLGVLPIFGIVLGFLLGGNPIDFLINTGYGQVCLLLGVCLTCAGLIWSDLLSEQR